jgi:hypothetical protein
MALRGAMRIPLTGDAEGAATLTGVMTAPEWALEWVPEAALGEEPADAPDGAVEDVLGPAAALAAGVTAGRPRQSGLLK